MNKGARKEFTKLIVAAVMFTYFVGVIVGAIIVFMNNDHLTAYLAYIGGATSLTIGVYCHKAKTENVIKIAKSIDRDISDTETQKAVLDTMAKEHINTGSGGYSNYGGYY